MGHVYSYTQADVVIRYHRMKGEHVLYPFGFDDNGLPTEIFTENVEGVKAQNVGRQAFIEACLELSEEAEAQFERFWKRLGLSVDWRLRYSTIDPRSRRVSQAAFINLFENNNVYRMEAPTLWCTTCQTGVAQADVEDQEGVASLFTTIPFSLADGGEIQIATTRPELLAACVAVFVHPDDKRYTNIVGTNAKTPIFGVEVPVLADHRADPEKGTGAVMCCTFGDVTDVAWWREHKLPLRIAITEFGHMNALAGPYEGLYLKAARAKILEDLASRRPGARSEADRARGGRARALRRRTQDRARLPGAWSVVRQAAGAQGRLDRSRPAHQVAPRAHAGALRELGRRSELGLEPLTPALLWRAVSSVVLRRLRRNHRRYG